MYMSKMILFMTSVLLVSSSFGQQNKLFQVGFQPEKEYHYETNYLIDGRVGQVKTEPNADSSIFHLSYNVNTTAKTGILIAYKFFPISFHSVGQSIMDENSNLSSNLDTIQVSGECQPGTIFPRIYEYSFQDKTNEEKRRIGNLLSRSWEELVFPEGKLKVDSVFQSGIQFPLPIQIKEKTQLVLFVNTTYKVDSIRKDLAYLSLFIHSQLPKDSLTTFYKMSSTGEGSGKMIYNIDKQFVSKLNKTFAYNVLYNIPELGENKLDMKISSSVYLK